MTPKVLSAELLRIASAIDHSSNPSRKLVARDLNELLAKVAGEDHTAGLKEKAGLALASVIAYFGLSEVFQSQLVKHNTEEIAKVLKYQSNRDLAPEVAADHIIDALLFAGEYESLKPKLVQCLTDYKNRGPVSPEEAAACTAVVLPKGIKVHEEGQKLKASGGGTTDPHTGFMDVR